ncbi:hypothetical protein [Aeromonas caviae]|uniref:hypothetical protein n=1 Tax=Aeromonas caviae TaxID=648 RepID=UPI0016053A26|nr:hypothetical protein [Aeromonas caviae]MDX7851201.1 hypothetical protein [Aeromonas caviae]
MSHSYTAYFPPLSSWQLSDLTALYLLVIGATIASKKAPKIGAILGPKKTELMGLGPKWGHKKSYEKPRLADGE